MESDGSARLSEFVEFQGIGKKLQRGSTGDGDGPGSLVAQIIRGKIANGDYWRISDCRSVGKSSGIVGFGNAVVDGIAGFNFKRTLAFNDLGIDQKIGIGAVEGIRRIDWGVA